MDFFGNPQLLLSLKRIWFLSLSLSLVGYGPLAIILSTNSHLKYMWGGRLVRCLSKSPAARDFSLYFLIYILNIFRMVITSTKSEFSQQYLLSHCSFQNLNWCHNLSNQYVEMKYINVLVSNVSFYFQFFLVICYLCSIFSTLVKVIK